MYHIKTVVNGRVEEVGEIKNVWYFRNENLLYPPASIIMSTFYDKIKQDLHANFKINTVTSHVWEGPADGIWWDPVNKKPLDAAPWGVGIESVLDTEFEGTDITNEMLPLQMAPCIFMKTTKKHVIGRKYFGGYTEGYGAMGVPITAVKNRLGDLAAAIMADFAAGSTPWITEVWGPKFGFNNLVSAALSPYLGTQRRRKPGVGS